MDLFGIGHSHSHVFPGGFCTKNRDTPGVVSRRHHRPCQQQLARLAAPSGGTTLPSGEDHPGGEVLPVLEDLSAFLGGHLEVAVLGTAAAAP